jgi:hypothetical protein
MPESNGDPLEIVSIMAARVDTVHVRRGLDLQVGRLLPAELVIPNC